MFDILHWITGFLFAAFFTSVIFSSAYYYKNIKPIADRRLNRNNIVSTLFTWSGQDLVDFWEVEKEVNETHDPKVIRKLQVYKRCLFVVVALFISIAVSFFLLFLVMGMSSQP